MDWHPVKARDLASLDQELDASRHSPAEYEVLRRVVYATGDLEFEQLLQMSKGALQAGAAAIASHSPIWVDSPLLQPVISSLSHQTFANPVYYCADPSPGHGFGPALETGAEPIIVLGQSAPLMTNLLEQIQAQTLNPALVILVVPDFGALTELKAAFVSMEVPQITIQGRKGGIGVALAVLEALIDLTQAVYLMR